MTVALAASPSGVWWGMSEALICAVLTRLSASSTRTRKNNAVEP